MRRSIRAIEPVSCRSGEELELWRIERDDVGSWVLIVLVPDGRGAGVRASVELTTGQLLALEARIHKALHAPRPSHPSAALHGFQVLDGGR